MKTRKKSDVGLVEASTQLNGENNIISNDLNVKVVIFYSPHKINQLLHPIDLFGLKNG